MLNICIDIMMNCEQAMRTIDVKNVFLRFLFLSRFHVFTFFNVFFIFQTFLIFKKRWQSSERQAD